MLVSKAFLLLSSVSASCPAAKNVLPVRVRQRLGRFLYERSIQDLPDRVFMRQAIIPHILQRGVGRVLNVGVRPYSKEITDRPAAGGVEVWTLDIDPQAARWGSPGRHIIGDATRIDEIPEARGFPCILFNGVFGWGIDDRDQINRTLVALSKVLSPDGLLVVGWNTDRIDDPALQPEFRRFRTVDMESFPSRVTFKGSTHVYDFLKPAKSEAYEA